MATRIATDDAIEPKPARARTVGALWRDAVAEGRDVPAYLVEGPEGWSPVSWQEAAQRVEEIAFGLLSLGVRKGESFGIIARVRPS